MEKRNIKVGVSQEELPPCRVCEAPSTGIHYGVISCYACKTFYRRNSPRADQFECAALRSCDVSHKNRISCAYCRMQKCVQMGMGTNASKTGRRTTEVNSSILKVKEQDDEIAKNCNKSTSDRSRALEPTLDYEQYSRENFILSELVNINSDKQTINTPHDSFISSNPQILHPDTQSCHPESESSAFMNSMTELVKLFQSTTVQDDFLEENNSPFNELKPNDKNIKITEYQTSYQGNRDCFTNSGNGNSCAGRVNGNTWYQRLYDRSKIEIYNKAIQRMGAVEHTYGSEADISARLNDAAIECIELKELKKKIFGPLKPITAEEYIEFYKNAGLDVDGRKDLMEQLIPLMEVTLKWGAEFAKSIPFFRDLCLRDQVQLFRSKQPEFFMIIANKCFNLEHRLFCPGGGKVFHMDDMVRLEGELAEDVFELQKSLRALDLTYEETVVLAAICIMTPDECRLTDPGTVEKGQDFLLECLFYLFDTYHPEDTTRFSKVINIFLKLKYIRYGYSKWEDCYGPIWAGVLNFPQLMYECFSYRYYELHSGNV